MWLKAIGAKEMVVAQCVVEMAVGQKQVNGVEAVLLNEGIQTGKFVVVIAARVYYDTGLGLVPYYIATLAQRVEEKYFYVHIVAKLRKEFVLL